MTPKRRFRWLTAAVLILLLSGAAWSTWVVHEINQVGRQDEAQPADAIAVFGAAEYSGRPSPVYHARLDHAADLYKRQIAPLVITFGGGADRNSGKTEGGVGRDYLLANGVPYNSILAETESVDTLEQVHLLAQIAADRGLRQIVLVSDPTHLFRIRAMCQAEGLDVYSSPRRELGHISTWDLAMRYAHEVGSYTAFRLGLE